MEWYLAVKVALQSLLDEKTRNFIIGLIIGIVMLVFMIVSIPTLLLSFPQMAFASEGEAKDMTLEYTNILVEYKHKLHDDVKSARRKFSSEGYTIKQVKINYPSLSAIISYDNVKNKGRYLEDKAIAFKLNKDEIFKFLDSCMSYEVQGETLVAKVKSSEDISKYFSVEEDRNMFVAVYETLKRTDLDSTVPEVKFTDFEYLEGGINLPYFSQRDKRWANAPYGIETIEQAGCGITSMTMVLNGLIPDLNILPPEVASWSYSNGYYVDNVGTSWGLFGALADKYGLRMKNLSRNRPQQILDELAKGNPVVVSLDPGSFVRGYHIIVLRGIASDGKILVSDPWSLENSQRKWDFELIIAESSSLSPSCFWAFSNK